MAQQVFFTPLPNGLDPAGIRKLSVAISPRLGSSVESVLSDWSDWVDWPATLASIEWKVRFQDTSSPSQEVWMAASVTAATEPRLAPDSALWQKLFPGTTKVLPFKGPKLKDPEIADVAATQVQDLLLGKFLSLARDKVNPPIDAVSTVYADVELFSESTGGLEIDNRFNKIAGSLEKRGFVPFKEDAKPGALLAQTLFYNSPSLAAVGQARREGRSLRAAEVMAPRGITRPPTRPTAPVLDFHAGLGSLGNHPQLLRKLGLVVDLQITLPSDLTSSKFNQNFTLEVFPTKDLPGSANKKTDVRVGLGKLFGGFEAKPIKDRPEVAGGLLRLGDTLAGTGVPEYDLVQLDTDGAAFKTVAFVAELERRKQASISDAAVVRDPSPPALRTSGVSVVRKERAAAQKRSLARQTSLNEDFKKGRVYLEREDLTRGYVFDVFDVASSTWYSLCRRKGEAVFTRGTDVTMPLLPEDGWVSTALSTSFDPADKIMRVPAAVARWANGWSLVTQRPGLTLRDDEQTLERHDPAEALRAEDLQLAVSYEVEPGSLPPQRYGRAYLIRARAVDLAGNVITSEQANALGTTHVLGPEIYRRFEPVSSPLVVPRKPVTEGEGPEVIVIRSNYNTAPGLTEPNDRHVYPPKIDQFRAEQHGMFDTNSGALSAGTYALIAARENGALDERNPDGSFKHAGAAEDPNNGNAPYYDLPQPVFQVEGGGTALVPYLTDPLARALAFDRLPGADRAVVKSDLYRAGASWPNVKPVRLRVEENPGLPAPQNQSGDELRIHLAKGEATEIKLSSTLREEDLDKLAVWAGLSEADKNALRADVLSGQHWALTPQRTVRLIHAIRQPNQPATFSEEFEVERLASQNYVTLVDFMDVDNKSTDRIDISAEWSEVKDFLDPDDDDALWEPRRMVARRSKLRQIPVDSPFGPSWEIAEPHELGHTRHIPEIDYDTVATSRFKDHFIERAEVGFDFLNTTKTLGTKYTGPAAPTGAGLAVVPESETVTSLDGKTKFRRDTHYSMDYPAGKITRIGNSGMDSDVRITYVKGSITREAGPFGKRAVSSARPDAPKVLYAVPTFKREETGSTSSKKAKHEPTGMRVYLDRPWWSSGDDEKLGVVIWPSATGDRNKPLPVELGPYVTQRGQDPIWAGAPTNQLVRPSDFTNKTSSEGSLELAEVPGLPVAVAAHDVFPDMERKLWYADIDIKPGSAYTPFVKLALVRYQANSVPGLELSPVVPLEFMQLYPSRVATATRSGDAVSVSVSGRTYRDGGEDIPGVSEIQVTVEQRRPETPSGDDAVGWMQVPGTTTVELTAETAFTGVTTWTGAAPLGGSGRRRVVFREYEQFTPQLSNQDRPDARLVYAEAIEF